ncbi:MAG: ABC transporter substrate-binding protein [Anaerolineaceae bacterium]|nr:ABC transporter substrate-binding protein [Anaerolineaceae bacterium]
MKRVIMILLSIIMILSIVGCATQTPAPTAQAQTSSDAKPTEAKPASSGSETGGEIVVGCLQDISGPTSTLGKMVEAGAKWAFDEINANGGVGGKKIKMITYDTKADVNEAINAFTRAVTADKVSVVIGPPIANIALAIAPISEQYNVPVVGFSVDTKSQVKPDGTPYKNMFAFQPSASQMAEIMATYAIKENNFKKFGVIYNQGNAYSNSLMTPFVEVAKANGAEVVEPVPYKATDKDFKTLLGKILSENVEAIFIPNYTQELILITQQARALGFKGALIAGLDACPPFNKLLGEPADGIYFINNIDATDAKIAEMVATVKEKTGIDATNKFFLGYDLGKVMAKIMGEVGTDSVKIRDAFESLKDYQGYTGNITIDPKTHTPTGLEMVMFTYKGSDPVMLQRYSVGK